MTQFWKSRCTPMSAGRKSEENFCFPEKGEDVTSVTISFLLPWKWAVMVKPAFTVSLSWAKGQENVKDRLWYIAESWSQSQELPIPGNFWFCENNTAPVCSSPCSVVWCYLQLRARPTSTWPFSGSTCYQKQPEHWGFRKYNRILLST